MTSTAATTIAIIPVDTRTAVAPERGVDGYRDRVVIAELDTNQAVSDTVDIVLYDSFAQPEPIMTRSAC